MEGRAYDIPAVVTAAERESVTLGHFRPHHRCSAQREASTHTAVLRVAKVESGLVFEQANQYSAGCSAVEPVAGKCKDR